MYKGAQTYAVTDSLIFPAIPLSLSLSLPDDASGIGYSIAERLGLSGAHVIICSRDQTNVNSAVASLRARGITVTGLAIHVGSTAARSALVSATVAAAGKIDILVSNVAVNPVFGPMTQVTDEKAYDRETCTLCE